MRDIQFLKPWLSFSQFITLHRGAVGPEKAEFFKIATRLRGIIERMPQTYEQDGKGDEAIAYLHYFKGGCDWYITEKDKGSSNDGSEDFQSQMFGLCKIWETELGYVSLAELRENGVELDFHFEPCKLGDIRKKLEN